MGRNRDKFMYEQKSLLRWLFEQEDEAGEDLLADEEPADEGEGGEEAGEGEEGGDIPAGGGGGGGGGAPGGEDEEGGDVLLEIEPEEEVRLAKSIDQDLEALLIDFEEQARKSQEIEEKSDETTITVEEGLSLRVLLEQEEENYKNDIDLDRFSAEVARLVKNYTSLLDMEKMLVNKARAFILSRYGEEAEKDLVSILDDKHDIEVVDPLAPPESDLEIPRAAEAGPVGTGGV